METVIIKVADATPRQIDWLVAQCEGLNPNTDPERRRQFVGYPGFAEANGFGYGIKQYSSDWAQGGPIVERMLKDGLLVHALPETSRWVASVDRPNRFVHGPTLLIAAMRCYVASRLGDEVEVPEALR